ncbi:hypothetical protein [Lentzea sp. NBRC 102530]|uniref:LGFP repeat-containing protein n=1 Tax=Lentzea sp. NBRC 102530 TaxID=3032201 RepID=UPI0024A174F2|nr:hypothetical protein [Lentzea sp. NBRC 102530]GLY48075.1 hypothetical protein Lesp01_17310 [Lentzea sp. NBRC 102530]
MSVRRCTALVVALAASTAALLPITLGTAAAEPGQVTKLAADRWEDSPVHAKWVSLGGASFAGEKVGDEVVLSNGIRYAKFAKFDIIISWREGAGAHWMSGAIARKWQSGGSVPTSAATMDQVAANRGSQAGAAIAYDTGYSVYYSDAYGAYAVGGKQRDKYWATGAVTGLFGWPTTDQIALADSGGVEQRFSEAVSLFQQVPAQSEAMWISGALRDKYREKGGPNGFGWLWRDQDVQHNNGWAVHTDNGSIYWSASTGAHAVSPKTNAKLNMGGGVSGHLGYPTTDTADAVEGEITEFAAGKSVYVSPLGDAFWMGGRIRDEYGMNGGPGAFLGWPKSDQTAASGTDGQYVLFGEDRDKVILWGPRTGAHVVSGPVLQKVRAGGDVAVYGLPQYGQMAVGTSFEFQQFEKATVFLRPDGLVPTLAGDFRAFWWQIGGAGGPLGIPRGDVYRDSPDFFVQDFDNGVMWCDYAFGECSYALNDGGSLAVAKKGRAEGPTFRVSRR